VTVGPRRSVVLATRSAGKLVELQAMAHARGVEVVDLAAVGLAAEDPAEDELEVGATFEANARAKARWFSARLPGHVVIADDSGLEVMALGGAPGVRSKRWTGSTATGDALHKENNAALLRALEGVRDRSARFVTVVAAVAAGGEWMARGECPGRILEAPSGAEGFGYDPLFWSEELSAAFGAVDRATKARVSHRARAFRALWEDRSFLDALAVDREPGTR
jgi:XTP/dITP diphosphohydrolase